MIKTTVDLQSLEKRFRKLEVDFERQFAELVLDLTGEAEAYAKRVITAAIYLTPERGGYNRSGDLRDSIYSVAKKISDSQWEIRVGASGSQERFYAAENELGTLASRRTFDEILTDAKAEVAELIVLEYGKGSSPGLEPRPWLAPTAVHLARRAPDLILQLIRKVAG